MNKSFLNAKFDCTFNQLKSCMNRGFDKETPLQKVYSLFVFGDKCIVSIKYVSIGMDNHMKWNGYNLD